MPPHRRRKPPLSPAYRRRNERARSLGYASYYDYRIHDSGRIPAGKPPVPKGKRADVRGHGSGGRGFLQRLHEGDLIMLSELISDIETYVGRDGVERLRDYSKIVVPEDGGPTRHHRFRRQTRAELRDLIEAETARGATFSLAPSLDQRRLLRGDER